jgi:hypothetical protein
MKMALETQTGEDLTLPGGVVKRADIQRYYDQNKEGAWEQAFAALHAVPSEVRPASLPDCMTGPSEPCEGYKALQRVIETGGRRSGKTAAMEKTIAEQIKANQDAVIVRVGAEGVKVEKPVEGEIVGLDALPAPSGERAGEDDFRRTVAQYLRDQAEHPASDLYDNEKMWLREAAAVLEDYDTLYSAAPSSTRARDAETPRQVMNRVADEAVAQIKEVFAPSTIALKDASLAELEKANELPAVMPRTFEYLLNAMEAAALEKEPAKHGYAEKRQRVFQYVQDLFSDYMRRHKDATDAAIRLRQLDGAAPSSEVRVHPDNIEVMISSLLSVVQYDMRAAAERDLRELVKMAGAVPSSVAHSLPALQSPDTFASYCIKKGALTERSEWQIAWELYRNAHSAPSAKTRPSEDIPLCAGHADSWFTGRNHLPGNTDCVVCAFVNLRPIGGDAAS